MNFKVTIESTRGDKTTKAKKKLLSCHQRHCMLMVYDTTTWVNLLMGLASRGTFQQFPGNYIEPITSGDFHACIQGPNESLHAYVNKT